MTFNLSKGSLSIRSGFRLKRKQAWKTKSPSHAKKMKISFVLAAASSCWPSTQESGLLSQRYIPETGPEGSGESGHGYGSPRSPHVRDQMPGPFLVSEQGCVNQGTAGKHPLSSNFHFISSIDSSWQLQRNVRGFLAKGKAISKQPSESTSFDGHLWPR